MLKIKDMLKRLNFFEKLLLIVGVAVTIIGFFYINKIYTGEGHISWALLQAAFLWLLLLFMIILTDSNESIKEELKEILHKNVEETKVLKEISREQLEELRVIKQSLAKNAKKK